MSEPTISLYELLEELRARDEAIDSLVIAYFKLEEQNKQLVETMRKLIASRSENVLG
jgi:hypothetical protein